MSLANLGYFQFQYYQCTEEENECKPTTQGDVKPVYFWKLNNPDDNTDSSIQYYCYSSVQEGVECGSTENKCPCNQIKIDQDYQDPEVTCLRNNNNNDNSGKRIVQLRFSFSDDSLCLNPVLAENVTTDSNG
jgi:hypothetical protein